eukprot:gene30671-35688_t
MTTMIKNTCLPKYLTLMQDLHDATDINTVAHYVLSHLRTASCFDDLSQVRCFDDLSKLPDASGQQESASSSLKMSESQRLLSGILAQGGVMQTPLVMKRTVLRVVKQDVYGAIYCLSSVRSDFSDIAGRLCEMTDMTSPHLLKILKNQLSDQYAAAKQAAMVTPKVSSVNESLQYGSGLYSSVGASLNLSNSAFASPPEGVSAFPLSESFHSQARSFTGALVSGLTEKLNSKRTRSAINFGSVSLVQDLQIHHLLDEGGFAKVFRGLYRGLVVGIKVVCDDGKNEKLDLMNAHEIAILSTISHPNVIQAYVCMTDVPVQDLISNSMANASTQVLNSPAYKYLKANASKICHIEVLEYCDLGNLASAVTHGIFFGSDQVLEYCDLGNLASAVTRGIFFGSDQVLEYCDLGNLASAVTHGIFFESDQVLEYCDLGNLAAALTHGVFFESGQASPSKSKDSTEALQVHMGHLIITLIEIGSALAEMHKMGIVHCDVKPQNVLLKSSNTDPRGFITKVSDFGLSSCGTVPYLAPEALIHKKKVDI